MKFCINFGGHLSSFDSFQPQDLLLGEDSIFADSKIFHFEFSGLDLKNSQLHLQDNYNEQQ